MRTIKINYILTAVISIITLAACKKSFVDIQPEGQFVEETFYKDKDQAYWALVGVYDPLRKNSGGFENMLALLNSGSDDHYCGGGNATDGNQLQTFSTYTITSNLMAPSYWNDPYQGIYRANNLLLKMPAIPAMDDTLKNRYAAEAKALRAFYYFNLVRMFKNIPLVLEPLTLKTLHDPEQVKPEQIYAQIEKDLTEAIPVLPVKVATSESGRFTKGAAMALLGKVYLYENKNTLAVQQLVEVNGPTPGAASPLGYRLLGKFDSLWIPANKFNAESILEETHSAGGNSDWGFWGSGKDEGNTANVQAGPRSYERLDNSAPDLASGWSFMVFTQNFYDFIKNDPRKDATLMDLKVLQTQGHIKYVSGYLNTGYFLNKFLPRKDDVSKGAGASELNYRQDTYIIRLADTYLMEAEALGGTGARAQALLDAVRDRVGLPHVPVTIDAIKNERRAELAGEGHRWFDLVRWGDAPTVLGGRGFVKGKHEIFPIPFTETQGTKIKQNPLYN
ncbi:carbohydrate-binding protein SusD [Niastella yeongjuensis]|uniref:Carbohydrate-binding protein SusD n=1 Tax=Niastella yeongjuensis TaxID=354355 RepID=A0A1V9EVZ9_9BACT|nr:RagB/SusD family nutrient uptake outer membrane protein [Niastella yeongjuensis]OQP50310.1 carbohydrate-binding protein SusD [Niastella yeongjuensis]SEN40146.1 Starch-binding associating with outer membrane [Niastella yeongjuensis]